MPYFAAIEIPKFELRVDNIKLKRADLVAEKIKEFIVNNKIKPGDRLPAEKELMRSFKSSRGTIRETLKSMEVQGLIEIIPGRNGGVRLCQVPYERAMQLVANYFHFKNPTAIQIYEVRKIIEPLMAENVVGLLKDEDFQSLEKNIQICLMYIQDESKVDRIKCREAELEFHNILARAYPNPFVSFICRLINDCLMRFVVFKKYGPRIRKEFAESNVKYHIKLVEAYNNQNRNQVRKLMKEHMVDAEMYLSKIEAFFEQGLVY